MTEKDLPLNVQDKRKGWEKLYADMHTAGTEQQLILNVAEAQDSEEEE